MSNQYQKLPIKRFPAAVGQKSSETKYWKRFKNPITFTEIAAIGCVDFSPLAPHEFAVASSTRVQIFDPNTNQQKRQITRFKDVVHSVAYRSDGKLMACGDDQGLIKLFDIKSRAILRQMKGHKAAVRRAKFTADNLSIVSVSDDKSVRCWDVPTGEQTGLMDGHTDYVRCAAGSPSSPELWITGGYDHCIKLWDVRSQSCVMTLDTTEPVEDVLVLPGGSVAISCGGDSIKVWDLLAGGKMLQSFSNHQKTITCIAVDGEQKRLLSGSLDQQLKVYELSSWKVVHSFRYLSPILNMGISPTNSHLVVGMADGSLSVRNRQAPASETSQTEKEVDPLALQLKLDTGVVGRKRLTGGTHKYYTRGHDHVVQPGDFAVEVQHKPKLREYDTHLKKFQYQQALDCAVASGNVAIVMSVVEELIMRNGLRIAVAGRSEGSLEPLLRFVTKNLNDSKCSGRMVQLVELMLECYASSLGQSMVTDQLFLTLKKQVFGELAVQRQLMSLMGSMDMLIAASESA